MKKILYLHAGAEMYGADKVLLDLVSGINKEKFHPIVILPEQGVLLNKLHEKNIEAYVMPYPILRRKYFNIKGIISYIKNYFKYSKKLSEFVEENNIDIIHNNTTAVLEGVYLKVKNKKKLIWHVHEMIDKPKIMYLLIKILLKLFPDFVVTVSNAVKDHYIKKTYSKKFVTIYNGVDNKKYYPIKGRHIDSIKKDMGIPLDAKVVGMIGRINAIKGQNDFIDALLPLLNNQLYGVMVGGVFKGEEYRKEALEKKILNIEFKNQLFLLDYTENTNLMYNIFDIFIFPSVGLDSFPTVVLEAMACGKPIIGYRHGGVVEMIDNNGILVEPKNIALLSRMIRKIIFNDSLIKEMSDKSIERQKSHFSLYSYIYNFEKFYDNI